MMHNEWLLFLTVFAIKKIKNQNGSTFGFNTWNSLNKKPVFKDKALTSPLIS